MDEAKKRSARTRPEQQTVMVDYLEKHPEMVTNSFTTPEGRRNYNIHWKILADTLNCLGYGQKSVEQWQRVLTDWLSKIKIKCINIKKDMNGTGGGPRKQISVNNLEERLIAIKGWSCIVGDGSTAEFGLKNQNKENNSCFNVTIPVTPQENRSNVCLPKHDKLSLTVKQNNIDTRLSLLPNFHNLEHSYYMEQDLGSTLEHEDVIEEVGDTVLSPNIVNNDNTLISQGSKLKLPAQKITKSRRVSGASITILEQQHKDTMKLLESINSNIERLADTLDIMANVYIKNQ